MSDNPSRLATIVTGKLVLSLSSPPAFSAPANVKLPLTTPLYNGGVDEFGVTLPVSKTNPVTRSPSAVVIVISLADILAVKFCWAILNIIDVGVAVVDDALGKANTCESAVNTNVFAVFEAVASLIASSTVCPLFSRNCPWIDNADPSHVNLSPNENLELEST